jgi:leader peptidase (prepilin peptidase)/N-methyltransferase
MLVFTAVLAAIVGLVIGSFLNVVIWRLPRGESLNRPPSHCPGCDARIRPYDNVPVISWLVLRGRCRACGNRISVRYPLVELATAALFAAMAARFGAHVVLPAFLYLAAIGVALSMIDLDTKRLPNAIVLPSYLVAGALLGAAAITGHDGDRAVRAVIGMVGYYGVFLLLRLAYPRGMGFGDVKLAGVLGLYLGWLGYGVLVVGAFGGVLLGGVVGVALMASKRAGRKSAVPYGPFMVAGALVAVFAGAQLAHAYLRTTGRA